MKSLYINTATQQTTIALFDGDKVVAEKRWPAKQDEAEKLQPAVDELLRSQELTPEDIQQLIVCIGPGGFTSTRIGVSGVNTWAFAKNLPVAQVSVFDLYRTDGVLVISANANEAWVKIPGKDPEFVQREQFVLKAPFQFGGMVHEEWKNHLEKQGGAFQVAEEQLPQIDQLEFRREIVKPWYYKDAKITWSEKILANGKSF